MFQVARPRRTARSEAYCASSVLGTDIDQMTDDDLILKMFYYCWHSSDHIQLSSHPVIVLDKIFEFAQFKLNFLWRSFKYLTDNEAGCDLHSDRFSSETNSLFS